jgi:dTDP-4-dehydrorhamnose 3,5-epimerase-like enzyme
MHEIKEISEAEGNLYPLNLEDVPFEVKRIFFVTGVPKDTTRGFHAHHQTKQLLICIKGSIEVYTYDGYVRLKTVLHAGKSIFIDKMVWATQTYLTEETSMLSLCSTEYDESDYIKSLNIFKGLVVSE